jgi:hypothetical protein
VWAAISCGWSAVVPVIFSRKPFSQPAARSGSGSDGANRYVPAFVTGAAFKVEDITIGAIQRLARLVCEIDRIDRVLRQVRAFR